MSDMIERVAKAIRDTNDNTIGLTFHELSRAMANAAVKAIRYTALEKRFYSQVDYAIDLQRIIEDLCNSREITIPQSGARHHYEMAVAYRAALSQDTPSLPLKPQEAVNAGIGAPHSSDAGTLSEAE